MCIVDDDVAWSGGNLFGPDRFKIERETVNLKTRREKSELSVN